MSKWLLWVIGVSVAALLGIGIYFGLRALEPRTYLENRTPSAESGNVSETRTDQLLPLLSTPPASAPAPAPPLPPPLTSKTTLPPTLSRATNAEADSYFAASTPREINPSTLALNLLDVHARVYEKDTAIITERPSAAVPTSLWKFNTKTKTLTPIVEKESGLMASWSNSGRFALLFSLAAQSTPTLRFIDTTLGTILPIRFTTLPVKCAVTNEQVIYCGVPKSLPPGTILPDDYLKKKIYTDDYVVMIDVPNTRIEIIFNESKPVLDVYNPARLGNALFFVNRHDDKVYKMGL